MATTGQRAFAQKLNKQGAAEVRRQVSSTIIDAPKSVSGSSVTVPAPIPVGSIVPISDVVDPPDFEEYILENQSLVDRDPYKDLLLYPEDDIEVQRIPKTCRTVTPNIPEPGADSDPHVYDCVKRFTSDYTLAVRRYQKYSSSFFNKERNTDRDALIQQEYEVDYEDITPDDFDKDDSIKRRSIHINDTPRGSWASSIFDLKQSQADPLLPNLFHRAQHEEIDKNNETQRQQTRQDSIFSLYPTQDEEEVIERRIPPEIPTEHFGHRICVKCLQLKLELEFEPIFASMALYDARERKKISENFYFDLNPDPVKRMINMHIPGYDISSLSRSCVFSITYPSPDVYLVVRLEKVLQQGDITECAEPYMKDDKSKEEKYKANASQFCDRLGKYRMPFAWTAVYLMNIISGKNSLERDASLDKPDNYMESRTASLVGEKIESRQIDRRSSQTGIQFESFRRRAKDDLLTGNSRRGSVDRGRTGYEKRKSWSPEDFSASLDGFKPATVTVSSFFKQESDKLSDDDLYKFLADLKRPSSVLKRVKCIPGTLKLDVSPFKDEARALLTPELCKVTPFLEDKSKPSKEVLEFPSQEVYASFTIYRNLLYVYPRFLNFASRQGSARNIAVKVQFMAGEEERDALPVIFGKSSCSEFTTEAYLPVTYHNKSPYFYEEIKIKMPAKLTDCHHLLFTFYHISCQNKKNEPTPTEVPVGYTWIPLFRDDRLQVQEYSLPVSLERLPPSYSVLTPDVCGQLPGMKWVDNHKAVFNVAVSAVSSIHPQDEQIDRFLSMCQYAHEQRIPPRMTEVIFEDDLKRSIIEVVVSKGENLVQFLPLIIDKFITLMVKSPIIGGQSVNVGQVVFESIALIVKRVKELLEEKNDHNGRNGLLVSYIHYNCALPHPGVSHPVLVPNLSSPTMSGYATLGRPSSLPVTKQSYHRSSSNPDLAGSTPTSPDAEISGFMSGKFIEKAASMKGEDFYMPSMQIKHRGQKLVHEELALQWVVTSGSTRELALTNAWFFFELMVKSMAEHLEKVDKVEAPRSLRFPDHFTDDINQLVATIIRDIVDRYLKDPELIRNLNTSLAFFLHDLLSLMDRGLVFQLIRQYCKTISMKIVTLSDATTLMILRLDFLRIICSHEHYFPLNLPFGTPLTPSGASSPCPSTGSTASQISFASTSTLTEKGVFYELTTEFRQQHFLVGLVLSDLASALETLNPLIHHKAINTVRNLLYNHDLDIRYIDPEMKARIAALYLPLIGITIDSLTQLFDPKTEARIRNSSHYEGEEGDKINQRVAMAIAGSNLFGRTEQPVEMQDSSQLPKCPLNAEGTRNLLICFLWVLRNSDKAVLKHWWSEMQMNKLGQLIEVIYLIYSNFEYKAKWAFDSYDLISQFSASEETLEDWPDPPTPTGRPRVSHYKSSSLHEQLWEGIQRKSQDLLRGTGTLLNRSNSKDDSLIQGKKLMSQYSQQTLKKSVDMKSKLEEAILGTGSARSDMMLRRRQTSFLADEKAAIAGFMDGNRLRWRKDQLQYKPTVEQYESTKPRDIEADAHTEGSLAAEVGMIALDCLELIIQIVQNSDVMQPLLSTALRVLLHSLSLNQSTLVLQHSFATQRSLVSKFLDLLFEEETEQCADLCLRLLRHCSSCIGSTRSHASASLYLLMRQNFEIENNFARVKMQVTMSLSSLVGQNHNFNEEYLRKSLKTILTYTEEDVELQDTPFPEQVRDLVFNLHMILSDTVKMKEFQEDPEMLLDLMYRIAKGYQTSPDLRLTWLQNMAGKHGEKGNHAEAAHCLIHAAGLVAEYLNMLEDKTYLPVGCVDFQKIASNVLEESAVSDDVVSPDEEGICTGKYFTESGLVGLLEQAASSFTMAGMYEAVNLVYKILIPIHEANRDFKKLAHIHGKLQESFNNVVRQEGKRIFGTYFRVGFYGKKFGDLDGEEFVYKEQSLTKLPEISFRLESFYGERFGHEFAEIIKDSNAVERDKLNPDKAYIQITYVEPFFDSYEFRERVTYFEKNYNIKRFMYATPFTLDGRAHGELHEQYKRKTILTTSHAFPYIKTRVSVINREQVILSPIEVAIEDLQKKTKELTVALAQEPPDLKILQMVLQGCIGTTVNQGPLEMAVVFLTDVVHGKQLATKHHNKLRLCFKDFMKKSSDSIHRNKSLIPPEQKEYQRELERNYHHIREKLQPLISPNSVTTLKKTKHHKSKENKESRNKQQSASSTIV